MKQLVVGIFAFLFLVSRVHGEESHGDCALETSVSCIIDDDRPAFVAFKGKDCDMLERIQKDASPSKYTGGQVNEQGMPILKTALTYQVCNIGSESIKFRHIMKKHGIFFKNRQKWSKVTIFDSNQKQFGKGVLKPGACASAVNYMGLDTSKRQFQTRLDLRAQMKPKRKTNQQNLPKCSSKTTKIMRFRYTNDCKVEASVSCSLQSGKENAPCNGNIIRGKEGQCKNIPVSYEYKVCNNDSISIEPKPFISTAKVDDKLCARVKKAIAPGQCWSIVVEDIVNNCDSEPKHLLMDFESKNDETCFAKSSMLVQSTEPKEAVGPSNPNLIVIMTDEHNMRTISAYRSLLLKTHEKSDVDVWGEDVFLSTQHIDRIADEGAIFSNFYTVAPLCTPSRSSFMTGMYPQFTGADYNHKPMDTNMTTFSQILRDEKGYQTAYLGKWHLDGAPKPGWGDDFGDRDFGWSDSKYRFNRGHWKYFSEYGSNATTAYESVDEWMRNDPNPIKNDKETYATDFLTDKAINFITDKAVNNEHFALFLSISDPHSPMENRKYFSTLFKDQHFKVPETTIAHMEMSPAPLSVAGEYIVQEYAKYDIENITQAVSEYEESYFWQNYMQQYFGMVKCIDKSIGKILDTLEEAGISDDTYVVFTSDHGDLLGEHGRMNKGMPYEMSAGIPFMIKGPKIKKNKTVHTAVSSIDFSPTILSLMNVDPNNGANFHGEDISADLISDQIISRTDRIIISVDTGKSATWIMAMHSTGYKLVVSANGPPFLFDLNMDYNELGNYIDSDDHQEIKKELQIALYDAIVNYNIPMMKVTGDLFFDTPACKDNANVLVRNGGGKILCQDLTSKQLCRNSKAVADHCPNFCKKCACEDSKGLIFVDGFLGTCSEVADKCSTSQKVRKFCRKSCDSC